MDRRDSALDYYPALDPSVEAEFTGSLSVCEDGSVLPTVNPRTGAVVDKWGVYRACEEPDYYDRYEP